ncbi:MAG: hypothetical protein GY943_03235, partial [Chloroflexi bacterium]|nr:hypothetical protein [Chloroflexota bacterium]
VPDAGVRLAHRTVISDPSWLSGSVEALGVSLVSANALVLPFEIASVLLLAALIGSIVVAWPGTDEEDA